VSNCWNCRKSASDDPSELFCAHCGEALKPTQEQAQQSFAHIQFLLKECERWESAPARWRKELQTRYQSRLAYLEPLCQGLPASEVEPPRPTLVAPVATPPEPAAAPHEPASSAAHLSPSAGPVRQRLHPRYLEETPLEPLPPPSPPGPPGESLDDLRQAVAEQGNISGLMMLGATLLLAAYIGFLKAFWEEGLGKQLASLSMVVSPAFFFWFAHWLRERLPQSSRMMSMIGGVLLPIGLLSLNHFHVLGLNLPSTLWSPVSFGLSAAVLFFQAYHLPEVACLYLAALSAFLAGLTTGNNTLLAFGSFGGAAAVLYYYTQSTSPDLRPHYQRISHLLAAGGLLSGVLRSQYSFDSSATIFLVGAIYYGGSAYMGKSYGHLLVSAITGLVGFWAFQNMLHLSSPMLGLCSLIQGSLYLSRGKRLMESDDPEERALGELSYSLGVGFTGVILCLTLGWTFVSGIWETFARFSDSEKALCVLTGSLGTLYYAFASYHYRKPDLLYLAATCCAYTYLGLVMLTPGNPFDLPPGQAPTSALWQAADLYRFLLALLPLFWQLAAVALRKWIPREYLSPWIISAAMLTAVVACINLVAQLSQPAGPAGYDLWLYLASTLVYVVAALWQRDGAFLYPGLFALVVAYTTFLLDQPHHEVHPNAALLYLPLTFGLALLTWLLDRRQERNYATPIGRVALFLGLFFTLIQLAIMAKSGYESALTPLLIYGVGFLVAGLAFSQWTLLTTPFQDFSFVWSSLTLLTALADADGFGDWGYGMALLLCAAGAIAGALLGAAGPTWRAWCRAQIPSGLIWSLAPTILGPSQFAVGGAVVWALPALLLPVREDSVRQWVWAAMAATVLGATGVFRVGFDHDACLVLTAVAGIQLVVCWRWIEPAANLCALVSTVLGVGGLVHAEPHEILFPTWWTVQILFAGFAFACKARRPGLYDVAQASAKFLAVGILVVLPHDGWGCVTAILYGSLYSVAGLMSGSTWEFSAGSFLMAWSLFLVQLHLHWEAAAASVAWAALAWAYLLAGLLLPSVRGFCYRFAPALTVPAWLLGGFIVDGTLGLGLAAAMWAARGILVPEFTSDEESVPTDLSLAPLGPANYHVAFFFAYTAWLHLVPSSFPSEAYTAPIGLWFLLWTELLRGSHHPHAEGWRRTGLVILLTPSVFLSLFDSSHGITALILGCLALVLGTALSQKAYMSLGPLALFIEIGIQALKQAVKFPWYVWALGAAVLIIGLALYTDYRRKNQAKGEPNGVAYDNSTSSEGDAEPSR